MKIIVTGSLGYVGKPLAQELIKKGHSVTVISSNPKKQKDIEALGAEAAIGTMEDVDFLTDVFTGADAVYCMLAPGSNFADGILGEAIGKPDLKWVIITDEQLLNGLKAFGMNASIAKSFVVMNASTHNGMIYEDYFRNKRTVGKVKLKDFANEFATVYNQK